MSSTTSITPTLSPAQDISSTFYVTLFTLGSILLILLIIIGCYSIFRTHQISNNNIGLFSEPSSTPKQGLDEIVIGSYPRMMFSQVKSQYGTSDNLEWCCSICLGDYKEVDLVLLLPNCGHFFHVKCVDQWLRLHPTCPLCRDLPVLVSVRSNSGDFERQGLRPSQVL